MHRNEKDSIQFDTQMIRNYLLVAARNLLRHPAYSLINVAGLAIGMAA